MEIIKDVSLTDTLSSVHCSISEHVYTPKAQIKSKAICSLPVYTHNTIKHTKYIQPVKKQLIMDIVIEL